MGTWEEKHFDLSGLEEFLVQNGKVEVGGLYISKISEVSGEMSRVNNRGKEKLGYCIKMKVEVEKGSKYVTLIYEEFNDYSDHEVELCDH